MSKGHLPRVVYHQVYDVHEENKGVLEAELGGVVGCAEVRAGHRQ